MVYVTAILMASTLTDWLKDTSPLPYLTSIVNTPFNKSFLVMPAQAEHVEVYQVSIRTRRR